MNNPNARGNTRHRRANEARPDVRVMSAEFGTGDAASAPLRPLAAPMAGTFACETVRYDEGVVYTILSRSAWTFSGGRSDSVHHDLPKYEKLRLGTTQFVIVRLCCVLSR